MCPVSGAGGSVWTRLLFICVFLAALALRCCTRAFSSLVAVHGLLIAVAFLVAEQGLWGVGSTDVVPGL